MAILQEHFYHKTISLYTAVFGSCFSNMKVVRDDGKNIVVPLAYAAKQRYNVRERQDQNDDVDLVKFMKRSPRMSFLLTSMRRDAARSKNKQHRIKNLDINSTTRTVKTQYNRVPYTFTFRLDIVTKYMDDMLQLIEQICVSFNPSVQVVIKDNPDLEQDSAVNITLVGPSLEDSFEGSYETGREITFSTEFELEGYLYMPTGDSSIIRTVYVNYHDMQDPPQLIETDTYTEEDAIIDK